MTKINISELIKSIYDFIKTRGGGVSYAEMTRMIDGFDGDYMYGVESDNIIFWDGMSKEAISAMNELVDEEVIIPRVAHLLVYLSDGLMLKMPIAKRLRKYKDQRWLPLVYWTPEQLKDPKKRRKKLPEYIRKLHDKEDQWHNPPK
jgi:hypothetical protein